jgi:DNA-directed RNA polymerase subunit omega
MRSEQITAKALLAVDNDSYLLAKLVAQRSAELKNGAESRLQINSKQFKFSDLALMELAEGLIAISDIREE